jgi:ABC-2 type transport system ATP-binding protein
MKTQNGALVEVENLTRKFGQLTAVDGVSFQVDQGEIFGFLGPNGAGKTTTINILCTLLLPTSGRASVCGHDVVKQRNQVRHCIGLVFQDPTLDEYLTAEQNLLFHAYAYNISREVRDKRLKELLTLVDLWDRRKSKVQTYSGGMKRRLEIARGLLHYPRVLFLDEPTLGLDPQTRYLLWEHIRALRRQENLTIFMTTHYMDEAENCDRIAIIDHGQIVALDTPKGLKDMVGGDMVTLQVENNEAAVQELKERYGISAQVQDSMVAFSVPRGEEFIPEFVRGFNSRLLSIGVRRPTLDDVFLKVTGRAIREQAGSLDDTMRNFIRMRMRHG